MVNRVVTNFAGLAGLPAMARVRLQFRCLRKISWRLFALYFLQMSFVKADVFVVSDKESALQESFVGLLREEFTGSEIPLVWQHVAASELHTPSCSGTEHLVVSVGTENGWQSVQKCPAAKHLVTLVDKKGFLLLSEQTASLPKPISIDAAVVIDQPLSLIFAKAAILVANDIHRPLLVLVSEEQKETVISKIPKEYHSRIKLVAVKANEDIINTAKKYMGASSGLVALPDANIWNPSNAKWLLYLAYQYRVPVVGYSAAFARAGAVLSIYSTPQHIAHETAVVIAQWQAKNQAWKGLRSPAQHYEEINESVFKVLQLPKSVLKDLNGGQP